MLDGGVGEVEGERDVEGDFRELLIELGLRGWVGTVTVLPARFVGDATRGGSLVAMTSEGTSKGHGRAV